MSIFDQYHGPSTDAEVEFLFTKFGDGHSELIIRPLLAGESDTAATWSPPIRHEDLGCAS